LTFEKQRKRFGEKISDSVKSLIRVRHLTHVSEGVLQGRRQNYFKFSFAPYNTEDGRIAKRSERKICGVSRYAGFGEGTPQQD